MAIPSESSYGLAVDPGNRAGVEAVYRLKRRDAGKPLLVVGADADQLTGWIDTDSPALAALRGLWPAPLTAILPLRPDGPPPPASAGGSTLAVRVPAHDRLRALLQELGSAVTATSANLAGEAPVLDPSELPKLLAGERAMIVDDGVLPGGPPSTLVLADDDQLRVLRQGAFPADALPALR